VRLLNHMAYPTFTIYVSVRPPFLAQFVACTGFRLRNGVSGNYTAATPVRRSVSTNATSRSSSVRGVRWSERNK
jgi:hypothetical protein